MFLSYFISLFSRLCFSHNIESRYSNEWNCRYYGLVFITWKYTAMNKSWLWPQNWLRQTCNVFAFTFIKYLFEQTDVLHFAYWMLSRKRNKPHSLNIRFNVKQVKQKPLKVCITWKVVEFWSFTSFQTKNPSKCF